MDKVVREQLGSIENMTDDTEIEQLIEYLRSFCIIYGGGSYKEIIVSIRDDGTGLDIYGLRDEWLGEYQVRKYKESKKDIQ